MDGSIDAVRGQSLTLKPCLKNRKKIIINKNTTVALFPSTERRFNQTVHVNYNISHVKCLWFKLTSIAGHRCGRCASIQWSQHFRATLFFQSSCAHSLLLYALSTMLCTYSAWVDVDIRCHKIGAIIIINVPIGF